MNETYSGGIGSFLLTMMIVSFLQMKQRNAAAAAAGNDQSRAGTPQPSWNLGTLLLEFFQLYGVTFNYFSTGVSIADGGSYLGKRRRCKPEGPNGRYFILIFTFTPSFICNERIHMQWNLLLIVILSLCIGIQLHCTASIILTYPTISYFTTPAGHNQAQYALPREPRRAGAGHRAQ